MHKDWVVRALVLLVEAQVVDGENVDPMLVDEPVERATAHTQKSRAVGVGTFEVASAPERYRARSSEFWVAEHVCNSAFGRSVTVPAHKVDVNGFMCA